MMIALCQHPSQQAKSAKAQSRVVHTYYQPHHDIDIAFLHTVIVMLAAVVLYFGGRVSKALTAASAFETLLCYCGTVAGMHAPCDS